MNLPQVQLESGRTMAKKLFSKSVTSLNFPLDKSIVKCSQNNLHTQIILNQVHYSTMEANQNGQPYTLAVMTFNAHNNVIHYQSYEPVG